VFSLTTLLVAKIMASVSDVGVSGSSDDIMQTGEKGDTSYSVTSYSKRSHALAWDRTRAFAMENGVLTL